MSQNLRNRSRGVTPVFVDRSGRRLRRLRIALFTALGLAAAYVVLIVASLFGVPTVISPLLAVPAHPHASASTPPPARPSGSPDRIPTPTPGAIDPQRAAATTTSSAQQSSAASTPAPTAAPAPSATPAPSPSTPGKSSTAPGQSTTAPGKSPTAHPTPPAHP